MFCTTLNLQSFVQCSLSIQVLCRSSMSVNSPRSSCSNGPFPSSRIRASAACTVIRCFGQGRLYDHACCTVLYEMTVEDGVAVVTSVEARRVTKARPVPMSTVELQKRCVACLPFQDYAKLYLVRFIFAEDEVAPSTAPAILAYFHFLPREKEENERCLVVSFIAHKVLWK